MRPALLTTALMAGVRRFDAPGGLVVATRPAHRPPLARLGVSTALAIVTGWPAWLRFPAVSPARPLRTGLPPLLIAALRARLVLSRLVRCRRLFLSGALPSLLGLLLAQLIVLTGGPLSLALALTLPARRLLTSLAAWLLPAALILTRSLVRSSLILPAGCIPRRALAGRPGLLLLGFIGPVLRPAFGCRAPSTPALAGSLRLRLLVPGVLVRGTSALLIFFGVVQTNDLLSRGSHRAQPWHTPCARVVRCGQPIEIGGPWRREYIMSNSRPVGGTSTGGI